MSGKTPKVGDPATYILWTDRYACTVVEVKRNGKELVLQRDKATRVRGSDWSEPQVYTFERDPEGDLFRVSRRKSINGKYIWVQVGCKPGTGCVATVGTRQEYRDPHF